MGQFLAALGGGKSKAGDRDMLAFLLNFVVTAQSQREQERRQRGLTADAGSPPFSVIDSEKYARLHTNLQLSQLVDHQQQMMKEQMLKAAEEAMDKLSLRSPVYH